MADASPSDLKESEFQSRGTRFLRMTPGQLYVLTSALLVLMNARLFYGSLKLQTEHVGLWFSANGFDEAIQGTRATWWSAPLDDVFIHFDFARATARGFPFQWSEGNGYSSGGTSLLYPFVLALGYLIGYRGLNFVVWAGIVACVCTFATLLAAKRLFRDLPPWTCLLGPAFFLSTGVLNWSLFSGMEVALFLALWGLCFVLWDDLVRALESGRVAPGATLGLGLACALLVATRPEAALLVAVFGIAVAGFCWKHTAGRKTSSRVRSMLTALFVIGLPGALVMAGHLWANKVFTGDSSAAGALAKLELHHPYLRSDQVLDAWLFHISYQVRRVAEYHFSAVPFLGYVVWVLGLLPLFFRNTRRYGILLWLSLVLWIVTVALNGQVRWQNERYTMPAVAWLMLAVALGIAGAISWALARPPERWTARAGLLGPVGLLAAAFVVTQVPRFREQVWFFGRASRNILEQHIRAGDYLRRAASPRPRRVMVSDAGAIPFVSDLPAFDLIGLGGYEGLPIAKASRQGVGAAVELIEHMAPSNRPDVLALYPSWWGTFVLWFGRPVHEFPVRGNVISGGASKVIYDPDWSPLEHSGQPFATTRGERVVDELDVADLLSERAHGAQFDQPAVGYVDMKMLPDPRFPDRDLWDAGRLLAPGFSLSFQLRAASRERGSLLIRVAPPRPARLEVTIEEGPSQIIHFEPGDQWQEVRVALPRTSKRLSIRLRVLEGDLHLYHLFSVGR